MRKAALWCSAGLAAISGVTFTYAWMERDTELWWVGVLTLLSAGLFLLSGLYARNQRQTADDSLGAPTRSATRPASSSATPPLPLGQILMHRYRLITQEQLDAALVAQRGTKRRLGEILVELGYVSAGDLAMALELQLQQVAAWRALHPDAEVSPAEARNQMRDSRWDSDLNV